MAFPVNIFEDCDQLYICMAQWANTVTEGMYWSIMLLVLGAILFMATFKFGTARAFGFATIAVGFISLLLAQMSLIPVGILTLALVLSGAGMIAMIMNRR